MAPQALVDIDEPINILYYGEGGTGKTTALATMANLGGKVLAINAESGIKRTPLESLGIAVENIELYPGPDEEISYEALLGLWQQMREELNEDPDSWAGVFWDGAGEIQQAIKDRTVTAAMRKADQRGVERSPFTVDRDNWREINEACTSLIRKFRDLPCHFGMSTGQRREQDDDGAVVYQPGVSPSLQEVMILAPDIICHTSVSLVADEEEFLGLFRPVGKFRGKDRLRKLPRYLVNPWFDRVAEYVAGDLTRSQDPVMQAARERRERVADDDEVTDIGAEPEKVKDQGKEKVTT